jgi:molecular chaperone DnaK (HSP70)
MCADLLDRVTAPIDQALAMAGLSLSDINAIEMLGGAQRVPAVQAKLQAHVGADVPLGVHLNADEASALGAAFHAANISTAFKVRFQSAFKGERGGKRRKRLKEGRR